MKHKFSEIFTGAPLGRSLSGRRPADDNIDSHFEFVNVK
jgi:hypothetical protein